MILELGKTYVTAAGVKFGPLLQGEQYSCGPWYYKHGGEYFDNLGRSFTGRNDLVAEWTEGPVRTETVTKRRIVPGVYGILRVDTYRDQVVISIDPSDGHQPTADELDAAARTLQQLAEALRDDLD